MLKILLSIVLIFSVAGCTVTPPNNSESTSTKPIPKPDRVITKAEKPFEPVPDFYKIKEPLQCVPYSREVSGFQIFGNAHTWWDQARGRYKDKYDTGTIPKVGAVYVLSDTSRLKYGHVSVVKRIIDRRTIEVAHTNWGGDRETRRVVYKRMPVVDVSDNNDWSKARFWNYPSKSYGSVYPADGFIYKK